VNINNIFGLRHLLELPRWTVCNPAETLQRGWIYCHNCFR